MNISTQSHGTGKIGLNSGKCIIKNHTITVNIEFTAEISAMLQKLNEIEDILKSLKLIPNE